MSLFDRVRFGFRFADTLFGDSLQAIAARELGDASRWTDLISYNKLVPPFITSDPAQAGPGVILTGQSILVPAPAPLLTGASDPDAVFEVDLKLGAHGELLTDGHDFVLSSGHGNLKQAISNRVRTERGELMFHGGYGCDIRRMIGVVNGPTKALLGARTAKTAVESDPRIDRVTSAVADVSGDVINVTLVAETIGGRSVQATVAA